MSRVPRLRHALAGLAALPVLLGACGGSSSSTLPHGGEPVELDPADFVATVDNPYFPLRPGTTWEFRELDLHGGEQRDVITVTNRTKTILGIPAVVVHDVATEDGELVEDTWDWYAQDTHGNVWYLGEDTKEYEHGRVSSTAGSWEAGEDGAQAGLIMPATPEVGMTYRQEYSKGQAEDAATVLSVDELVQTPSGLYKDVVFTKDYTPLRPDELEHKFYAKNVGLVTAMTVAGGRDWEELVRYR
jgi:hypothetical protein